MIARVAALIVVGLAAPAHADFYDGLEAYQRGDFAAALREWQPLAAAGNAEAQFQLGRLYAHGEGVARDERLAGEWYRKAAEQGHARAQNNLGVLHQEGRGVERDEREAARWYRLAAEQGRTTAQVNLARLYDEGRGVDEDPAQAALWFRRAADRGHAEAQYRLGRMLDLGRGLAQDRARAAKWYRKAAREGNAEAQNRLGEMYAEGIGVGADRQKALAWFVEAAEQGLEVARRNLDRLRDTAGEGSRRSAAERSAVARDAPLEPPGETPALPGPREDDDSEDDDSSAVLDDALGAAEADDPEAQYRLGLRYSAGDGVPRSTASAEQWYRRAAERGHGLAAYRLAFLHLRGRTGARKKDYVQAYFWFHVAAQESVGDAARWLERVRKKMSDEELAAAESLTAR
jgi:TPR repeat protein